MGNCLAVKSCEQIYNAESYHGYGNAVLLYGHQSDQSTLGSVHSREGSKGLNQDSAILYHGFGAKNRAFCGVFDGHGKNGHFVSEMVRNRLPALLLNQSSQTEEQGKTAISFDHWRETMMSSFRAMDEEIKLQPNLDLSCSGTTAVVAIHQDDHLVLANLGDSRAVLATITETGLTAVPLTIDLKPSLTCESERIKACNGRVVALKNEPHITRVWLPNEDMPGLAMSRAFGDFLLKDYGIIAVPEVSYHRVSSNDQFVVLATDGVWDVMSNEDVAKVVRESAEEGEEAAARAVVEAAHREWERKFPRAKVDDCSVVCLFLNKDTTVVSLKT